ncbi:MAG: helix-turn-helix transcriptional regulator [Ruminococcaceae bacterium]|nr:helix-turn-helix transcriptional regulator [Oscillospiraceae bacterium]
MRTKKDINIEIGANIQTAREQAGYTQERLAEILDLSPNHISAIERGVSAVSLDALKKICVLFGISSDVIIFGNNGQNDDVYKIAQQLSRIKPEHQPQIKKVLSALLELSAIMQDGEPDTKEQ